MVDETPNQTKPDGTDPAPHGTDHPAQDAGPDALPEPVELARADWERPKEPEPVAAPRRTRLPIRTPESGAVARFTVKLVVAMAIILGIMAIPIIAITSMWLTDAVSEIAPQLDAPPSNASLVIQTADQQVIGYRGVYQGRALSPDEIPAVVKEAVIAIEDRRFHDHAGIDFIGISRAAWTNFRAGEVRQGGSTITQQLAKMLFLSSERNMKRKVQESVLALWLERHLTKDEILARYLNMAYFGAGAYGLDAAAMRFFDKSVSELTLSEAAMLAGLIRAPSLYNPFRNSDLAFERTKLVLTAMAETGGTNRFSAIQAMNDPPKPDRRAAAAPISGYVTDFVAARANRKLRTLGGDYTVTATIDPTLQAMADDVVRDHLDGPASERGATQAALIAMRLDGAILAMVGGRDYEESQFNRASQARRQPGSLFKVFVYLTALSKGWHTDDFVIDEPIRVGAWRPRNYNDRYYGRMTLTNAFARSANSVAVRLQEQVGRDSVIEVAKRLGLDSRVKPHPSLALGTFETTLLDITGAFAAIAANRTDVEPYIIATIDNPEGMRYTHAPRRQGHALGPARDSILHLLNTATRSGTGQAAAKVGTNVYGKTGTTQDHRDAWFVGFTDDVVVGVWVGNDDNTPMDEVTGGSLPAHIWAAFVNQMRAAPQRPALMAEAQPPQPAPEPDTANEPDTEDEPDLDGEYWLTGPGRVITTARIRIGGETVTLRGVIGETGHHADRMQDYIDGKTVRCRVSALRSATCTADGTDIAVAVVFNGGGWAGPDASAKVREAERRAREAGRGVWSAYDRDYNARDEAALPRPQDSASSAAL